jgi:hypothetical protein
MSSPSGASALAAGTRADSADHWLVPVHHYTTTPLHHYTPVRVMAIRRKCGLLQTPAVSSAGARPVRQRKSSTPNRTDIDSVGRVFEDFALAPTARSYSGFRMIRRPKAPPSVDRFNRAKILEMPRRLEAVQLELTLVTLQTAQHGSTSPRFASAQRNHGPRRLRACRPHRRMYWFGSKASKAQSRPSGFLPRIHRS